MTTHEVSRKSHSRLVGNAEHSIGCLLVGVHSRWHPKGKVPSALECLAQFQWNPRAVQSLSCEHDRQRLARERRLSLKINEIIDQDAVNVENICVAGMEPSEKV